MIQLGINLMKTESLPTIKVTDIGPITMHQMQLDIDNDVWFNKICDEARKEIPNEEVFNWWFNEALKETIGKIEKQTKFQKFCFKYKIKLLRLLGKI